MSIMIRSELTGELAPCTINEGILLDSGERIGAIADIDALAMFTVDMHDATVAINKNENLNLPLPLHGAELWKVEKKGKDPRFNLDVAAKIDDNDQKKSRIELYAEMVASGQEIVYLPKEE